MLPASEAAILVDIRLKMVQQRQLAEQYLIQEAELLHTWLAAPGNPPPDSSDPQRRLVQGYDALKYEFLLQLRAADDFYADRDNPLSSGWSRLVEELQQGAHLSSIGALATLLRGKSRSSRRWIS